jgi:ParB-like nuclease domain
MQSKSISLSDLLLDPNNYRLQEQDSFALIESDRFHLERVQSGTLTRLRRESIKPLRDSIFSNGFLEIERIVVTPYEHAEGKYLVIEGNRRIAALLQLRDEHEAGINVPQSVVSVFDAAPCLLVESSGQEAFFREAIMGIRHVGGIKEWGGFQRAKLISDLQDTHFLDSASVAQRLGLSVQEVNRRYRAFRALQQMKEDEIYSEYATAGMYPIFHEAVSLPIVREWLDWNSDENEFQNAEHLEIFYQLISPRNVGQHDEREAKIRTYSEVRQLREILPNSDAKSELMRMDRDLVDAMAIATKGNMARRWRNEVAEAKSALANIPGQEIQSFGSEETESIKTLIEQAEKVLEMHRLLTASS